MHINIKVQKTFDLEFIKHQLDLVFELLCCVWIRVVRELQLLKTSEPPRRSAQFQFAAESCLGWLGQRMYR